MTNSEATKSIDGTPSILERLGLLSGATAALSVVVSFFYDWGFFTALGISFEDAPTTITDHIRSWLLWLPALGVVTTIAVAKELFIRRLEHGMTEDEIIESSPNPDRTARARNRPYKFIAAMGPTFILIWVLLGDRFFEGFLAGLAICWVAFMGWVFGHPTVWTRHPFWFRWSAFALLPVPLFFFYLGFISIERGDFIPAWDSGIYTVHVEGPTSTRNVKVLRSFEKWLLVNEDDAIVWIPVDHIRRMEVQKQEPYRGLLCTLFGCEPTSRAELEKTLQSDDS